MEDAEKLFEFGLECVEKENFDEAFEHFSKTADMGFIQGVFCVG
ncbi:23087_t:CDS:1, partial [Dentiscutata erythropus]